MDTVIKSTYTVVTFAPVQGHIEKSRKLRDLHGASQILSYLSQQIVLEARETTEVISPAIINLDKGMPNRILLKGEFSEQQAHDALIAGWKRILQECRTWVEKKLPQEYHWEREWRNWGNYAWEVFWGEGNTIEKAIADLETHKLSRAWTAINWIGESSSLTGTDGIAFPGLGAEDRNPRDRHWKDEDKQIKEFYKNLACVSEYKRLNEEPSGKFIAPNEKLSIPELVKRLVTREDIAENLGMTPLGDSFSDIYRRPEKVTETDKGRWTGWFMGDGDKVGDHLKKLAKLENGDEEIQNFSKAMRLWGEKFSNEFPKQLGRVVYAGGDDFLGAIYSEKEKKAIQLQDVLNWLMQLPQQWKQHEQDITLSVGFIWAGHSVPQRDILQHCREAEKVAKALGRNRVTIRILFNSGQYVEWTCPWKYLGILREYRDKNHKTYLQWEKTNFDDNEQPNWSHIYTDLAQLTARHAFQIDRETYNIEFAVKFLEIYFPKIANTLLNDQITQNIVGFGEEANGYERAQATVEWIINLIKVGWHLCSNI
ncbi:CRISPR-associated protein Cmr2 [Scytonema hofmannii FACHB-248]|uniref:CRISPR-associated protein Cmr2 n=1 Tax=Scytonema hofmannii FACHB-248 TaxID=1842502 RepID=A0ABR8GJJ7_9CYAN|nr:MULTISPECIES: type III-B CRISPR-associated protein Cas10/Cmr2 [Nostocales]MBD2603382.1 CRISPR-associated protein Cmr2 [Scytonema hofmannii FACHB-248]